MRQLERGDPTDLDVLRALADSPDQPQFAETLAARIGIPATGIPVRLRSLVSLGYVDCLLAGTAQADGYTLTERGAAEVLRRGGGALERPEAYV
jgi:DNA-binding IclR family transcriptional regulator